MEMRHNDAALAGITAPLPIPFGGPSGYARYKLNGGLQILPASSSSSSVSPGSRSSSGLGSFGVSWNQDIMD